MPSRHAELVTRDFLGVLLLLLTGCGLRERFARQRYCVDTPNE
jgi:hypothetical protein